MPRYEYSAVTNPQWMDAHNTTINVDVKLLNHPLHGNDTLRVTVRASDPGWEHIEEIFARAVAGEFGPIAPYDPPAEG